MPEEQTEPDKSVVPTITAHIKLKLVAVGSGWVGPPRSDADSKGDEQ